VNLCEHPLTVLLISRNRSVSSFRRWSVSIWERLPQHDFKLYAMSDVSDAGISIESPQRSLIKRYRRVEDEQIGQFSNRSSQSEWKQRVLPKDRATCFLISDARSGARHFLRFDVLIELAKETKEMFFFFFFFSKYLCKHPRKILLFLFLYKNSHTLFASVRSSSFSLLHLFFPLSMMLLCRKSPFLEFSWQ